MPKNYYSLFVDIDNSNFIFVAGEKTENNEFKIVYKNTSLIQGVEDSRIVNYDLALSFLKKNIFLIEQKLNFTFKEIILIINNYNLSFINLSGYKKLNGSQILKENIIYILNSLKSSISKIEEKKNIIHIFNSRFFLDKKELENIPIGLFGDFYSHELSFCLMNKNDFNNLNNIFGKCNLKIKKIYIKDFIQGSYLNDQNEKYKTFFLININKKNTNIFLFENSCLKFQQNFNFGSDFVTNDIVKVTSLKKDIVEKIISTYIFNKVASDDELLEKIYFKEQNYRKIKKNLLFNIAKSRIEEFLEKFILKNINFSGFYKKDRLVIIKLIDTHHQKCFKKIYESILNENNFLAEFKDTVPTEDLMVHVNKIAQYGWKKEAIPVTNPKKSMIAKFFEALFN